MTRNAIALKVGSEMKWKEIVSLRKFTILFQIQLLPGTTNTSTAFLGLQTDESPEEVVDIDGKNSFKNEKTSRSRVEKFQF